MIDLLNCRVCNANKAIHHPRQRERKSFFFFPTLFLDRQKVPHRPQSCCHILNIDLMNLFSVVLFSNAMTLQGRRELIESQRPSNSRKHVCRPERRFPSVVHNTRIRRLSTRPGILTDALCLARLA